MILNEELNPADISIILKQVGIEPNASGPDGWKTIRSPLRDEKNPSFGINTTTGAWKDHSTGDTGDVVNLVEAINRVDTTEAIKWIREMVDMPAATNPEPQPNTNRKDKPEKFWAKENIQLIKSGMDRIQSEPDHEVVKTAFQYDCLQPETLQKFGCGIVDYYHKPHSIKYSWLAIPYGTGCQLYRRNNDEKLMYSVKGSKPGNSLFGTKHTARKNILFVAKSPRETMLLYQEFAGLADVVGIATGEQGKISKELRSELKSQISASNYSDVYVFFDRDTEKAKSISSEFGAAILEQARETDFNGSVKLVDIHAATSGAYKDITDCIRADMDRRLIDGLLQDAETAKTAETAETATPPNVAELFDITTAPRIPDVVYENLPEVLKTRCSLIDEPHRRDVFLMASLPVVASHMENVIAGHADGYYTPDLYTLIVADPGAGKGIASKAKRLGETLNNTYLDNSKRAIAEWEQLPDEAKIKMDKPKERTLYIPANSSSRAIYDTILTNGGSGLLFETEIDTMLNATGQEWGNFSDITRKAFHHEAISINRKNERFFIDSPRLSICLSGTFDQFKKMFESAENGHFSRYGLYTFDVQRVWQSHRPTKRSRMLDESIKTASDYLFDVNRRLAQRTGPLYIDLTEKQWQAIDDTFAEKMQIIEDLDLSSYLHASNNRAAILSLRLSIIFIVLRVYDTNAQQITDLESLTPTDADLTAAIWLADTFIKHAIRLYQILPNATDTDGKGERYKKFTASLPNEFKTAEAIEIAEAMNVPKRTAERWLNTFTRIGHGEYRK